MSLLRSWIRTGLNKECTQDMRHARPITEHGTKTFQVLLYVLLYTWLCHGRVFVNTQKRWNLPFYTDTRSQKDSTKMGPNQSSHRSSGSGGGRTTTLLPVIKGMGFLPQNDITHTHDIVNDIPPDVVNVTMVTSPPTLDAKIWNALISKYLQSKNKTNIHSGVDTSQNSSQWDIPHLVRLGYGVAKVRPGGQKGITHHPASKGKVITSSKANLKHYIIIGAGSFLGGMTVILLIIFVVLVRNNYRKREIRKRDAETGMDDAKLRLLDHEEDIDRRDSGVDVTNELSTSSSSNVSTNNVDIASNASDNASQNSSMGDVWLPPDHIALSTLQQPEYEPSLCMEDIPLLSSEESYTENRESPPSRRSSTIIPSALYQYDIPDLLLNSSHQLVIPPTIPEHELDCVSVDGSVYSSDEPLQGLEEIGEEGGIIRCQGTDIVMVIPPGAVTGDRSFPLAIQTHEYRNLNELRKNEQELILSPVMELVSPEVNFFHEPIALKFPFRSVSRSTDCACEDDPLCGCANNAVELRYCDTSTSSYGSTRWCSAQLQLASGGHYSWPACLRPEPRALDTMDNSVSLRHDNLQTSRVTFRCSDSVCCVRTNRPGYYALVWQPKFHSTFDHIPVCINEMDKVTRESTVRMCVTIGAKCQRDLGSIEDGMSYLSRHIIYTVYIGDNATSIQMAMEESIRRSGAQQQCACTPIDVTVGSEVKVTLSSALDADWLCQIPSEYSSRVLPWQTFCSDFGTVATAEFLCLPKLGCSDVGDVVSVFDVSISRPDQGEDSVAATITAWNPSF